MSAYIGIGIIVAFFVGMFALIASTEGFWGATLVIGSSIAITAILVIAVGMAVGSIAF